MVRIPPLKLSGDILVDCNPVRRHDSLIPREFPFRRFRGDAVGSGSHFVYDHLTDGRHGWTRTKADTDGHGQEMIITDGHG